MERRFKEFPWQFRAFIIFRRLCICAAAGMFYSYGVGIAGQYFSLSREIRPFSLYGFHRR